MKNKAKISKNKPIANTKIKISKNAESNDFENSRVKIIDQKSKLILDNESDPLDEDFISENLENSISSDSYNELETANGDKKMSTRRNPKVTESTIFQKQKGIRKTVLSPEEEQLKKNELDIKRRQLVEKTQEEKRSMALNKILNERRQIKTKETSVADAKLKKSPLEGDLEYKFISNLTGSFLQMNQYNSFFHQSAPIIKKISKCSNEICNQTGKYRFPYKNKFFCSSKCYQRIKNSN